MASDGEGTAAHHMLLYSDLRLLYDPRSHPIRGCRVRLQGTSDAKANTVETEMIVACIAVASAQQQR